MKPEDKRLHLLAAQRIRRNAHRWVRLLELDAPEFILENERRMMLDTLTDLHKLPVDSEIADEIDKMRKESDEHTKQCELEGQRRYEASGSTVPWAEADDETRCKWVVQVMEEELGIEHDKPNLKKLN